MLILDENGKVTESNNKTIDELKRESYKHGNDQILKEEEREKKLYLKLKKKFSEGGV